MSCRLLPAPPNDQEEVLRQPKQEMPAAAKCRYSSSSSSSSLSLPYPTSPSYSVPGVESHMPNTSPALNMSPNPKPTVSSGSNSIAKLENTVACSAIISIPHNCSPIPKSSTELRMEIATLEAEILHLERYLLLLYRTAFEEQLPTLSNVSTSHLQYETGMPSELIEKQTHYNAKLHLTEGGFICPDQTSPAHGWASSDNQSCTAGLSSKSLRGLEISVSGHRSLADHLGPSCMVDYLDTPDKLSVDIIRCISSIYCRFSIPSQRYVGSSASPLSSLSSSSIFSSHNWSPHCIEDSAVHHRSQELKVDIAPYATVVEVLKICVDDGSFNYAALMLKKLRSLVRRLEKVDPRKMTREQKLAFWINIHNALIMHAYLAYGTHNRVKTATIFKASYNVGGHCINASIIQSSIFGIWSHYSEPWLQALFSPGRKLKTGSSKHVYALEYPEPLVHFALCSGVDSDPVVRVYTSKSVFRELKVAKEEFIQASVYIHKEAKIFVPKILSFYAKDMSIDTSELLEVIGECLTDVQQRAIRKCMRRKVDKTIHWLPEISSFRYLIHGELAKC